MTTEHRFPRYSVAELFSGCGGFSHGFARTGLFNVLLGVDIKPFALETFRANHQAYGQSPRTFCEDVRTLPIDAISAALAAQGVRGPGALDCLIGGPPCQGFSQLRRGERREQGRIIKFTGYNRYLEDPRNALVLRFLEIAAELRPKFIVIENVPQMLRHSHQGQEGHLSDSIIATLRGLEYDVAVGTLNAADYGVPQLRERAIIIASSVSESQLPLATHGAMTGVSATKALTPWVAVKDAISDLPAPPHGRSDSLGGGGLDHYLHSDGHFVSLMQSRSSFPFNHVTRKYNDRILAIIREMSPGETWDHASNRMQRKYRRIVARERYDGESESEARDRLIGDGRINATFYKRYYWSAYTRLDWARPALTITANANFLGSGRFTHPQSDRGITIREAARLQSFDDDFRFITDTKGGTTQIGVGLDMIGEAVPPLLGRAIAADIARTLSGLRIVDESPFPLAASR